MDTRKGFLTPEQEEKLDKLIELKGLYEAMDGTAIKLLDNQVLQRMKANIPEDVLPVVYEVIDEIFDSLTSIAEN
jgi:hypothetical protein